MIIFIEALTVLAELTGTYNKEEECIITNEGRRVVASKYTQLHHIKAQYKALIPEYNCDAVLCSKLLFMAISGATFSAMNNSTVHDIIQVVLSGSRQQLSQSDITMLGAVYDGDCKLLGKAACSRLAELIKCTFDSPEGFNNPLQPPAQELWKIVSHTCYHNGVLSLS